MIIYYFLDTNIIIGYLFQFDYLYTNALYYFGKKHKLWSNKVFEEAKNKRIEYVDAYVNLLSYFKKNIKKFNYDVIDYNIFSDLYNQINLDFVNNKYYIKTGKEIISFKDFIVFKEFMWNEYLNDKNIDKSYLINLINRIKKNIVKNSYDRFNLCKSI